MKTIYFEMQTGLIRAERSKTSNFYQFAVPESATAAIEREVSRAGVGSGGFEYSPEFLPLLQTWEQMWLRGKR